MDALLFIVTFVTALALIGLMSKAFGVDSRPDFTELDFGDGARRVR
jgi:hypothetical protein